MAEPDLKSLETLEKDIGTQLTSSDPKQPEVEENPDAADHMERRQDSLENLSPENRLLKFLEEEREFLEQEKLQIEHIVTALERNLEMVEEELVFCKWNFYRKALLQQTIAKKTVQLEQHRAEAAKVSDKQHLIAIQINDVRNGLLGESYQQQMIKRGLIQSA